MLAKPDTFPIDLAPLKSTLSMPYTLTPGRAAGSVLAELKNKRLVASKFRNSGKIVAPAQDFCPFTGDDEFDLFLAPSTGVLQAFTEIRERILGLIRIDGTDVDFAHRISGAEVDALQPGARVEAVWAEGDAPEHAPFLALSSFRLAPEAPVGKVKPLDDPATPLDVVPYKMTLHYEHAFGPYYGRMFDEIRTGRKIMGVRTPDGEGALLPPREICDLTHKPTGTWVEIKHTGTVRACSIINLEFVGQTRKPPYIYAEIKLDGASTRLIHTILLDDMSNAKEIVKPGTRVRAVWSDAEPTGSLSDISHFEVIGDRKG
ncbi:MAG: Zn-ribbon domain-containing OB-fold protein [Parvularculaceae bacterium]